MGHKSLLGWCLACVAATSSGAAELAPELQLALGHLREGERAALQRAAGGQLERLPLYQLQLTADPKGRSVLGTVIVSRVVAEPTAAVWLQVSANASGANLTLSQPVADGRKVGLDRPHRTLYRLSFEPAFSPGEVMRVGLKFSGRVPRQASSRPGVLGALGTRGGYGGAFSAVEGTMNLVGLLPQLAGGPGGQMPAIGPEGVGEARVFEPSFVLASVEVPVGHRAIASGVELGEVPLERGRVRYAFAAAAVRDFPVFVTRPLRRHQASAGAMQVEGFFDPDFEGAQALVDRAAEVLGELEKRLGPLPWRALRLVQAPLVGGAGGLPASGLLALSRALVRAKDDPLGVGDVPGLERLLGPAGLSSTKLSAFGDELLELTMGHGLAHQYFPAVVGSDRIRRPVHDEALAQALALQLTEWRRGKELAERLRRRHLVAPYQLFRLGGGQDGAAARSVDEFADAAEYDALVQAKAAHYLLRARELLGDEAYARALRGYLTKHRYQWTCDECLSRALSAQASPEQAKALATLERRWWQEAAGDEELGAGDPVELVRSLTGLEVDPKTAELLRQLLSPKP
jgi:hypothetical protein